MVDWPTSASTMATGSLPACTDRRAATPTHVVLPLSDAPITMAMPGSPARASHACVQPGERDCSTESCFIAVRTR